MQNFEINLFGLLSLIGLIQTVYAFVYLVLRAGDIKRAMAPLIFFATLSGGFLMSFVDPYVPDLAYVPKLDLLFWSLLPVVSVVLIVQVSHLETSPSIYYQLLYLFVLPLTILVMGSPSLMLIAGILCGAAALLTLWMKRDFIGSLCQHKVSGRERYWLVLAVVFMNVAGLALNYSLLSSWIDESEFFMIRVVLGLALVYLVSTTMFRIYPQSIELVNRQIAKLGRVDLEPKSDPVLVDRLKDILDVQKLYQESNFSRSELAREMGISETVASKLVGDVYGKSLPQLISERRIAEACDLLRQTSLNISAVAEQVGFNSIASFNRVFKEIKGESPSEFRVKLEA